MRAANAPPLATAWNIASTGKAATSGELVFRVTAENRPGRIEVRRYGLVSASGLSRRVSRRRRSSAVTPILSRSSAAAKGKLSTST